MKNFELRTRRLDPEIGKGGKLIEKSEPVIDYDNETPADENGNYSINITLGLVDKHGTELSKSLTVVSNNSQTGSQVDLQRKREIAQFMKNLNK